MSKQSLVINLGPHLTTSITDDHWKETDFEHLKCWKHAVGKGLQKSFTRKGHVIELNIDFSPAIVAIEKRIEIMQGLETAKDRKSKLEWANQFDLNDVNVHAEVDSTDEDGCVINTTTSYIDYILHDMFIVMNLSSPGSCNFYTARVINNDSKFDFRLSLSNHNFEMSMIDSIEGRWPKVRNLPLGDVEDWYSRCRPQLGMLSTNRMERAIFALLHLAKSEISAPAVIWIFYALEAIYDTRPGENYRSLLNRICLTLKPEIREKKALSQKFRELYDVRSAFAHGGFEVVHPMANEVMDKSVQDSYSRLMKCIDFGSRLVIASLQEIILRGWIAPTFQEIITGIDLK